MNLVNTGKIIHCFSLWIFKILHIKMVTDKFRVFIFIKKKKELEHPSNYVTILFTIRIKSGIKN